MQFDWCHNLHSNLNLLNWAEFILISFGLCFEVESKSSAGSWHNWNSRPAFSSMIWGSCSNQQKVGIKFSIRTFFYRKPNMFYVTLGYSSCKKACCAIFLSICFMPSHVQWWVKLEIKSRIYVHTSFAPSQKDKFQPTKPNYFLRNNF